MTCYLCCHIKEKKLLKSNGARLCIQPYNKADCTVYATPRCSVYRLTTKWNSESLFEYDINERSFLLLRSFS